MTGKFPRYGIWAVAAVLICGCAMMTQSAYEYMTTSVFGKHVEITAAEKDTLAANFEKAAWLARFFFRTSGERRFHW